MRGAGLRARGPRGRRRRSPGSSALPHRPSSDGRRRPCSAQRGADDTGSRCPVRVRHVTVCATVEGTSTPTAAREIRHGRTAGGPHRAGHRRDPRYRARHRRDARGARRTRRGHRLDRGRVLRGTRSRRRRPRAGRAGPGRLPRRRRTGHGRPGRPDRAGRERRHLPAGTPRGHDRRRPRPDRRREPQGDRPRRAGRRAGARGVRPRPGRGDQLDHGEPDRVPGVGALRRDEGRADGVRPDGRDRAGARGDDGQRRAPGKTC